MSTDRELLEMAAKAAGLHHDGVGYASATGMPINWDSLEDDGDAFRLLRQVDYGLLVEDGIVKIMNNLGGGVLFLEIRDADEMTVIRRAITMAAA
ncbi:hypothetical protein ACXYUI_26805, partial [Klebsiella pneumoniae]